MDVQSWLTLLGALGIPVIVTAAFKLIENRQALRGASPRTNAEALDIGIVSQKKVIETLEAENTRLAGKLTAAEELADKREARSNRRISELADYIDTVREDCRRELAWHQAETARFRGQVQVLLTEYRIDLPDWWFAAPAERPEVPQPEAPTGD